MVICPDCGKDVIDAKFCKNCGAKLPETKQEPEREVLIPDINYCKNCGYELSGDVKFCPSCGTSFYGDNGSEVVEKRNSEKNIIVAIILSVILPGLGQFYLGFDHKGSVFLIAYFISLVLIMVVIGFLFCVIIWIWALVDSIQSANALKNGIDVEDKLL